MFTINRMIIVFTGITLVSLTGAGINNPKLFENQGFSNLTSMLVGGMLGVISAGNTEPKNANELDSTRQEYPNLR